ncbi:unnamed protein product [Didymodactylos carnosus]|uniref:DnaJ homolog subfamily C member 10 n=1 Tax=Didymodactylos carnosus TaxID=1234261 RepID=A0A813UTS3_9BILA|nr:unnamed protein product [Didymodactylos carnosus]CAF1060084.1 unnamed protein product [Didymodactylos carnosus]CAF3619403.1 unnamed protein product [Didymodactylos carnosus]CAF3825672.1 unnamed protein product [Didymodactylos carnosus]
MTVLTILSLIFIILFCSYVHTDGEDFYKLLDIEKSASQRDIRRAFKKIALEKHPDKRAGDPNAHSEFVKINRAYEILRDDELRKKYDQYGEQGLKDDFNRGNQYQSWSFYKQNFGIYDEDPEIITLSRTDFLQSIDGTQDIWFINYYSPQCGHCHDLAPVWREIAKVLEGVIRIGAVNCMDEWALCNEQGIQSYPSLLIYPRRDRYNGHRHKDDLIRFAMSFVTADLLHLNDATFKRELSKKSQNNKPFLIVYCRENDEDDCLDKDQAFKLAAMLNNLVQVGIVNCRLNPLVCQTLKPKSSIIYYEPNQILNTNDNNDTRTITSLNIKEIASQTLSYLPDVKILTEDVFNNLMTELKQNKNKPLLVHFVDQKSNEKDLELRKLPSMLNDYNIGRFECSYSTSVCQNLFVTKLPTFILFKLGGYHEFYYGRYIANDVATFVRENAHTIVRALNPNDFPHVTNTLNNKPFIIDYFSPHCPPCLQLLPEFRKSSKKIGNQINFGTVDCTIHNRLCQERNIHSYPSTIIYNESIAHQFHGQYSEQAIINYVDDILHPSVIILDNNLYENLVVNKKHNEMWLLDFFTPWCPPCQQLSGEWRQLAKFMNGIANIATVDCTVQTYLCQRLGIQSFPTIRLYPPNSGGNNFVVYNNGWRDANSLRSWAFNFLPSKVIELDSNKFSTIVLRDNNSWVVDFYAPWCGHCHQFSPIFEGVARKLEGKVNVGKVNCDIQRDICERAAIRAYPTIKFYKGAINSKRQEFIGEDINQLDGDFILHYVMNRQPSAAQEQSHRTEL